MILVSRYFTDEAFLRIKELLNNFEVKRISATTSPCVKTKALIIRSKDLIDQKVLTLYPNLEVVASSTSGFDHIDFKCLKESNIQLCYSPNANVDSASELTVFHILNFLKKGDLLLKKESAPVLRSQKILGEELSSKKVSIIGLGRIGLKVAQVLKAFGCEVKAYDPYVDQSNSEGIPLLNFKSALEFADIVSLHCPLTKATKSMINKESLSFMKPSSVLVNCARGELINEADLISALDSKKIQGACLDVFEKEPLPAASPLPKLNNTLLTPHIGGFTAQAQEKSALEAAQQVKNWFELSSPVVSLVPPDVAWIKDL